MKTVEGRLPITEMIPILDGRKTCVFVGAESETHPGDMIVVSEIDDVTGELTGYRASLLVTFVDDATRAAGVYVASVRLVGHATPGVPVGPTRAKG